MKLNNMVTTATVAVVFGLLGLLMNVDANRLSKASLNHHFSNFEIIHNFRMSQVETNISVKPLDQQDNTMPANLKVNSIIF